MNIVSIIFKLISFIIFFISSYNISKNIINYVDKNKLIFSYVFYIFSIILCCISLIGIETIKNIFI